MTTNNDNINVANNVAQRNSQDNELMKKIFPHKEIIEGESVLVFPYIEEASPLKDVPQEVVSHMEKTIDHISQEGKKVSLTEQWKKGDLEAGWYYVLLFSNEEYITFIDGNWVVDDRLIGADIKEVLAPVLSFEECNKLQNSLEHEKVRATHYYKTLTKIEDENEKLEELLKECYKMLAQYHIENSEPTLGENIQLLTKIDEVLK